MLETELGIVTEVKEFEAKASGPMNERVLESVNDDKVLILNAQSPTLSTEFGITREVKWFE